MSDSVRCAKPNVVQLGIVAKWKSMLVSLNNLINWKSSADFAKVSTVQQHFWPAHSQALSPTGEQGNALPYLIWQTEVFIV